MGPAADVFSLGCVLVYALTGRMLFGEGAADAVLYRIAHAQPDPCGVGNHGCLNAAVRAYPEESIGTLLLVAQPGHFDGADSTIMFSFSTDRQGYLHLTVTGRVSQSILPDPVNIHFATSAWDTFADQLGANMRTHNCPRGVCWN